MKGVILFSISLLSTIAIRAQETSTEPTFNEQIQHQLGVGFAITGFHSSFSYFVSPHYSVRYHRHWFGFTPFYGRLDDGVNQQDLGIGLDYRLYPFKNLNSTQLYFPLGLYYNYKWSEQSQKSALIYKVGFGVDNQLGKHFSVSLDTNFGIGQTFYSNIETSESASFGPSKDLNFYFLPVIRIAYNL
ncbi:MAG: hypothetical protein K9G46_01930 [Flavobacteriales bacterium]|nr:hypothetical protein [Flavobacteriales bacterium]